MSLQKIKILEWSDHRSYINIWIILNIFAAPCTSVDFTFLNCSTTKLQTLTVISCQAGDQGGTRKQRLQPSRTAVDSPVTSKQSDQSKGYKT